MTTAGPLPLATRDDLVDELQIIEFLKDRMDSARIVNLERWQNRRDSLTEWEQQIRQQLAEMKEAPDAV